MAQGRPQTQEEIATIVAPATPPGESALAVLRLSGPRAVEIAGAMTGAALEPRRATAALATVDGAPLDRVVVTWFKAPHSYTGEDLVEVSSHGSPYVRARLLQACVGAGARLAEPGEFTLRAFLAGKLDLAQAEGVAQLIRARSGWAHQAALAALEGGLSARVASVRDRLLALAAGLEVSIDHPEEDAAAMAPARAAAEAGELEARLRAWLSRSPAGAGAEGLRVCIVGAPNVGKSSLLNALLGRERAIVLDAPGTTRDVLEERVELGGAPIVLIDTAGLREGRLDPAEALGIERTRRAIDAADLCLLTFDASRPLGGDDAKVEAAVDASGKRKLAVWNKCDLSSAGAGGGLRVSARTGEGLEELCGRLRLEAGEAPKPDEASAVTARQREALAEAAEALAAAASLWREEAPAELAAVRVREALSALDRVAGGAAGEDVLRTVFSSFCIGK